LTKKETPAPGYALLADLQTTLNGNGDVVTSSSSATTSTTYAATQQQLQNHHYHDDDHQQVVYSNQEEVYSEVGNAAGGKQNLQELDTLLDDLNRSRFAPGNGVAAPPSNGGHDNYVDTGRRPSVDALLNELSNAVVSKDGEGLGNGVKSANPASSATEELDVLMASLSTFKGGAGSQPIETGVDAAASTAIKATNDATYAKPNKVQRSGNKDQLDSMLGNLQADMNKQGISATTKGCCTACDKPIVGQVVTALGRTWHPDHFVCAHCRQELGTKNFFERDGQPYCEPDYHHLFSPRCAYCNGPILDKCVTALEQTWHPDHFFCAQCGCQFGEEGFQEKDGKPYCKSDYLALFALKCKGCSMAITEGYISALSAQWHADCFVCRDCNMLFQGGSFFVHEGMPYCETHYHAKRGSLCAGCHKPITGRCITAMFRKFHPEHFVCSYCLKQLKKGTFKEQGDKPYCHGCFDRLFG